mmetsp:Transcript_4987/g.19947  ORF Transcript_4987/g.19947 Transcript_4987/m.19947 type:complete len:175 (-) Transcript_4987:187-711(-)
MRLNSRSALFLAICPLLVQDSAAFSPRRSDVSSGAPLRVSAGPAPPTQESTKCSEIKEFQDGNPICKLDIDRDGLISKQDMLRVTVKAIAYNKVTSFIDNPIIGIGSSLLIAAGALWEAFEVSEEFSASAAGIAVLSIGHALHYFREFLRELIELDEALSPKEDDPVVPETPIA